MVPGAVASDLLKPGDTKDLLVGAGVSAATAQFIFVDESKEEKRVRVLYRQRPTLGFGAAYLAARLAKFDPQKALMAGTATAILMVMVCTRFPGPSAAADNTTDQNSGVYVAVTENGPGGAPAAIDEDLLD